MPPISTPRYRSFVRCRVFHDDPSGYGRPRRSALLHVPSHHAHPLTSRSSPFSGGGNQPSPAGIIHVGWVEVRKLLVGLRKPN